MKFFSTIVLLFCFLVSNAQIEIFGDTQAYLNAFVNKNTDSLTMMTYENIVEMAGGKEFFEKDVNFDFEQTKAQGLEYLSANIMQFNVESIYPVLNELHALVPHDIIVKIGNKQYRSTTHILAISNDGGSNWKFVNLSKYTVESLKIYVPNLPDGFVIPESIPFEELRN